MLNGNLNNGNLSFEYVENDGLYYEIQVGADTVRKKCDSPARSGYSKLVAFSQWPGSGRTITTTITDYSDYQNISQSNIQVGIRSSGGHGTDDFGGDDQYITAYCSGYNATSGTVSIFISGNIRAGNVILCII